MKKVCGNCRFCNRAISSMPCRICKDWNRWKPKKETTEFTIEELEEIKAEIDEPMRDTTDSYGRGYACAMFKCLDILDNHIKELKGENNDENKTDN